MSKGDGGLRGGMPTSTGAGRQSVKDKELEEMSDEYGEGADGDKETEGVKLGDLVVLVVCLLVSNVQALEGNPTYGVKLCGREFIRAVIFTCGGSRWKRAARGAGDLSQEPFSSHNDEASDSWSTDSIPGLSYQQLPEMEDPGWARDGHEGAMLSRSVRSLISEEVLEALRTSDRKGRDVVVGLSNACCKWGCSKSEISSLC
ncbi:hypothetical protein AAFF_G00419140 [Aldrovandia affinis]|uniref:Relaxin-3 n=1 Tax=Aldrovandia affinis TaxID=143900 RepID=A0AAD7S9Y1_9TELE|nr:hypothetical protein AAFF_G00419140 [Aldrovandia affinis]